MIQYGKIKGHHKTIINENYEEVIKLLVKILKKKLGTNILCKFNKDLVYVELNGIFYV
jgi:hypothetical protein